MRAVLTIVGVLLVLIIGVIAYVVLNSGNLIKQSIETYGSEYLGAPVTVDAVDVSLADVTGEVRGFQIGNPPGFDGPYAMRIGRMSVTVDAGATTDSVVVLNEVSVDGASLRAVARGRDTNFQQLLKNVEERSGPDDSADGAAEDEVLIIIDRLHFTNADTQVSSDLLGEVAVQIPDLHLEDIGRKSGGATIGEVLRVLLRPVTREITKAVVAETSGVKDLEKNVNESVSRKLQEFKDKLRSN